jgi:uncharacterized protein
MTEYRSIGTIDADNGNKLSGTSAPFNRQTIIGNMKRGGFREKFRPGAFADYLSDDGDVVLLAHHDTAKPMARLGAGTLRVRQMGDAIHWDAACNNTTFYNDTVEEVRSKAVKGTSFGFDAIEEVWTDDDGNLSDARSGTNREVVKATLPEISIVTFPAYGGTEVSTRDAVSAARESRAAKATYSDLYTCSECGATSQYGAYCADCGQPMTDREDTSKFCTTCGQAMGSDRASHVCETRDTDALEGADASLDEAVSLFKAAERDSLPAGVNQAIGLVLSAWKAIGSHNAESGIPDPDDPNGNTYAGEENESDTSGSDRSKVSVLARRAVLESKRYV